jgi:hypothetical protein
MRSPRQFNGGDPARRCALGSVPVGWFRGTCMTSEPDSVVQIPTGRQSHQISLFLPEEGVRNRHVWVLWPLSWYLSWIADKLLFSHTCY